MKNIRVHFVHLGAPQVATAAVLSLRKVVDPAWTVSAATIQHIPRENDAALQEALDQANIIVCMGKHTFNELEKRFAFDARKMIVWDDDRYSAKSVELRCDELATYIQEGSWIDVVNKDGTPTGLVLPASWVCDRGYWHCGVHIVLMTREGGAVLEIRSKDIFSNPGRVDVTLGGFVDAGETPEHAALRELKEELGIVLGPEQLELLDVRERSAWHPRHRMLSRSVVYAYMSIIDEKQIVFRPEFSEVAGIAISTPKHLNDLLRGKNVKGLGTVWSPAYNNAIVRLARRKLKQHKHPRKITQ
jgi:ADP-ribose pyrophosphatase YjhB (NUDIX family)